MKVSLKKQLIVAAALGAASFFSLTARAADLPAKIGIVDLQQCLNESTMGKKYKADFTTEAEKLKTELEKEEANLAALREEIETQGDVLAEDAKAAKEAEYKEKVAAFKEKFQATQQALQRRDQELTRKILKDLQGLVREIGEKEGYTMIVEKNESGVLFAPTQTDMTEKIIELYNKTADDKE